MGILVVGFGSIGKRHVANLVTLGCHDIALVRRNPTPIDKFKVYPSIEEAASKQSFSHAIIATPTALHLESFKALVGQKIENIYIEKPISHDLEEAVQMTQIVNEKNINVIVGYDLRFDPGLNKVRELLATNNFGKPLSFLAEVGQYLPDWRPHEDYREGMSAKRKLGGGVLLDLIHEFDYLYWIFGPITSVFGVNRHISLLEIETEDVAITILETDKGLVGSVYLDYLQKELARTCKIVCDKGTIVWDYSKSMVKWMTHEQESWTTYNYQSFERNDRFIEVMKAFLASSSIKDDRLAGIVDGMASLKIVEGAKKSCKEHKLIQL